MNYVFIQGQHQCSAGVLLGLSVLVFLNIYLIIEGFSVSLTKQN